MTFDPSTQRGAFANRQAITAEELRALRGEIWGDGTVSAAEAEKLFAMNRLVEPSADWTDLFVEGICEFMLSQGEPRGYVTEDEATWLLRHVNQEGRIETAAELELIVKLLERAEYAPASLRRFALGAIERTVIAGEGPTRTGARATEPRVEAGEAAMIRRLIFAPAGEGPAKVSAAEAEMLFRIKDATIGNDNCAEWKKLFVQGIANHLMAHQGYSPPSPPEEMRIESAYEPHPFGHFLSRLGRDGAGAREFRDAVFGQNESQAAEKLKLEADADGEVTSSEGLWLRRLYDNDAKRDDYEQALLDFLAEDGAHPF